jgi:hypothetical protein
MTTAGVDHAGGCAVMVGLATLPVFGLARAT